MSEENEGRPNEGGPFDDAPVVYGYSRAQALADGVLVDVSAPAAEAGFRLPVAVTAALWARYVVPAEALRRQGQSEQGRLHDVLTLLRSAIGRLRVAGQPSDRITFPAAFLMPGPQRHDPAGRRLRPGRRRRGRRDADAGRGGLKEEFRMGPEHQDVREQPTSRFVRLSYDSGRLVVNMNASGPAPFMPAPASRIDWLVACAGRLWRQRRRCLAALLVLHAPTGRWTVRLPRQRCSPAGVSWTVVADDFAGLAPDWVLGGTFQAAARGPQDFEPLAEVIPPADGLHFVLLLGDGLADLRAFVRAGGELRPAGEQPVMVNDWAAVLDAAKPRLTLA